MPVPNTNSDCSMTSVKVFRGILSRRGSGMRNPSPRHAGAQHNLGGMYEFGHGVTRDDVLAYMWYHLAADQPNGDEWRDLAAENRDGIAEHLTSVQIADAKKRVQKWKLKGK